MGASEDWNAALESLEPDKQKAVHAWIDTQMFIARELGLESEEWFEYVEWAFKNPFDFEFASEHGSAMVGNDGMVNAVAVDAATKAVGSMAKTKLPGGGGPGNLLNMIVDGKKDRG